MLRPSKMWAKKYLRDKDISVKWQWCLITKGRQQPQLQAANDYMLWREKDRNKKASKQWFVPKDGQNYNLNRETETWKLKHPFPKML